LETFLAGWDFFLFQTFHPKFTLRAKFQNDAQAIPFILSPGGAL
jgi:hypothetical protein